MNLFKNLIYIIVISLIASCTQANNVNDNKTIDTVITKNDSLIERTVQNNLLSWNNTENKQAIIDFVQSVCSKDSADYIKPENRIAVFDLDGTLIPEKPTYFQIEFVLYRIKQLAPQHKEWKRDKLIKAALNHDLQKIREKFGVEGMNRLMTIAQSGMNIESFNKMVTKWLHNEKHPVKKQVYSQLYYLPMQEMINYLLKNDFKIYISGGGLDFIRVVAKEIYDIPTENIIGSFARLTYKKVNGKPVLIKNNNIVFLNEGKNKVLALQYAIGKKPVLVFANSDRDIQMLEWCNSNDRRNLNVIIHHTDKSREWAYDRNTRTGKLDRTLSLAAKNNWITIDMKKDWKFIFPFEQDKLTAKN